MRERRRRREREVDSVGIQAHLIILCFADTVGGVCFTN